MTNEELIERLRQLELRITMGANEACGQAADAIERLTAQLAEARQAERAAMTELNACKDALAQVCGTFERDEHDRHD